MSRRPAVIVEKVLNSRGDISHCRIEISPASLIAPFSESFDPLEARVEKVTGIELTVTEVMAVTAASREQMEREASRLKEVLLTLPSGTVANVEDDLFFWINSRGELVWADCIPGQDDPAQVYPGLITCIGEIDTHELYAIAQSIRMWLAIPAFIHVDPNWLIRTEIE
ncbi:hypothetical protein [Pseudomonas luteola]|uniref:Uncharacterized protein n=1 Tax=Pseudomonas luteola TaxID=47886 RepID=A0ABS0FRS4_PSELU|nr:hypothetical protein [Pseudomonas zeshuii]MBF8643088.1 hypothetical protein [Pseudomonas zeshuii]